MKEKKPRSNTTGRGTKQYRKDYEDSEMGRYQSKIVQGKGSIKDLGKRNEELPRISRGNSSQEEKGYDEGGTKKPSSKSKDSVLDAVKKSITAQYGKGAIMRSGSKQEKKVKGAKTDGEGKYLKQA